MPASPPRLAGALAAIAPVLLVGAARGEIVEASYVGPDLYEYRITHMPAFDQFRAPSGDGIAGLPNNGVAYCTPAIGMNMCAYVADHGFPSTMPLDRPWSEPWTYRLATSAMEALGNEMGTSPTQGTSLLGMVEGLESWVPLDSFIVNAYFASPSWSPRAHHLAQAACDGALVSFFWGWYEEVDEILGTPVVERDGGHGVTLTEAHADSNFEFLILRDPAADSSSLTTQSTFTSYVIDARPAVVIYNGQSRIVEELYVAPSDPIERLLDGFVEIRPKTGVTFTESTQTLEYVQAGSLFGSIGDIDGSVPAQGSIGGITLGLHGDRVYGLRFFDPLVATVDCYRWSDGSVQEYGDTFFEPGGIVLGAHHVLYVASQAGIDMIDVSGGAMEHMTTFQPDGIVVALDYDDANDRLVTYDAEFHAVITYPWDGNGPGIHFFPPDPVQIAQDVTMAFDRTRGAVWLVGDHAPTAWRLPLNGDDAIPFALPGATQVDDLSVDDQGHLFVADAGVLREYRPIGDFAQPVFGPLAGMEVGSAFAISRGRTNRASALFADTWHDVAPPPLNDPGIPDCPGDVDHDGTVDFADLVLVLSAYGPCPANADCATDVNRDDVVDFVDLLVVLSNWGPCPE